MNNKKNTEENSDLIIFNEIKEKSCSETIGQLIINYRDNYYENERSINIKKNLLNASFILILISTLVIIIGIIMNIICKGVIK